jgi:hypothetical protein
MQHANPTGENREVAIVTAKSARQDSGLFEIAIFSLAGLTLSLVMIAQGLGPDAWQLMLAQ